MARIRLFSKSLNQKRQRRDRLARYVIAAGGWTVLVTLGLLIWHLIYVSWPLIYSPSLEPQTPWSRSGQDKVLMPGSEAHQQLAILRQTDCQLSLARGQKGQTEARFPLPCSTRVKATEYLGGRYVFELSGEGLVRVVQFRRRGEQWDKQQRASFFVPGPMSSDYGADWQVALSEHWYGVALPAADGWSVKWVSRTNPLDTRSHTLSVAGQLTLLPSVNLAVVTAGSQLHLFSQQHQQIELPGPAVSVHAFSDDKALMVGLADGRWQKWDLVNQQGRFTLRLNYEVDSQSRLTALESFAGKDLLALLAEQELFLMRATTGEILVSQPLEQAADRLHVVGDELFVMAPQQFQRFQVSNLNSTVSFESLWTPLLYSGYPEPAYVWQSTTANDDTQAKYSLVPLVIGSLKAALVALVVAVPLALGAAIYTAYFVPQRLRNWLKPGIEMLEAIPSVVIGFIAAIWLTPVVEEYLFGLMVFLISIPVTILAMAAAHRSIAARLPHRWQSGWELVVLVPLLALILTLCLSWVNDWQPATWQQWVGEYAQDSQYSSKNAIVIALALGIAIAPSIYSLAEDAIYEVPPHLRQASLALGATRIQTLFRVVLVTAYPGIFSAVMLGLSRAFGETMILLMVTGNTPVPDWDLFSGIRTLTANIAIELPESNVGSIHYRILFFTTVLLFAFTFVVNTLAELIRRQLRRHYQRV